MWQLSSLTAVETSSSGKYGATLTNLPPLYPDHAFQVVTATGEMECMPFKRGCDDVSS